VLVSLDVARRRGRLRLDGIARTVITPDCYKMESTSGSALLHGLHLWD
jgi:hypothetical protein